MAGVETDYKITYILWGRVVFRMTEYKLNGEAIKHVVAIASSGDGTVPPESDLLEE